MPDTVAQTTIPKGTLMQGKRGIIMGVANNRSIAWAIAQAVAAQGGEVAFTYQGEALEKGLSNIFAPAALFDLSSDLSTAEGKVSAQFKGGFNAKLAKSPWQNISELVDAFYSKGRLSPLLQSTPVYVILNGKTALQGAAWYAAHVT